MPPKATEKKSPIKVGDVVHQNYKILQELGRGGYGVVYKVEDTRKKKNYAIKVELERPNKDEPGLKLEIGVLKRLQGCSHVVRYIDSGVIEAKHGFLIMQLIDRNLADIRRSMPEQKFTTGTAVRLCLQCLEAIEYMHNGDLLHRDIKPGNFAMGKYEKDVRTVFILDFGMVRRYRVKGVMRKQRPKLGFRGTVKYASPNVHSNTDISRRDDLWSWLFLLVEFLKGTLPWVGVADRSQVHKLKTTTKDQQLDGLAPELAKIYEGVAKLKWAEDPPYEKYKQLLTDVWREQKLPEDAPFDWEEGGLLQKQSAAPKSTSKAAPEKKVKENLEGEVSKTELS